MSGFLVVNAFAGAARLAIGVAAIAVVPLAAGASPQDDHAPLKSDVTSAFSVVAESAAQSPDLDAPFDVKEFLGPYKIGDEYLFQILGRNQGITVFSLNEFELCRIDIKIKKANEWKDVGSYVDLACDGTFENTRRPVTLIKDYTFLKSTDVVSNFMRGVDFSIADVGTHFWSPILAFSRPLVASTARLQKYFGEEKNKFSLRYIEGDDSFNISFEYELAMDRCEFSFAFSNKGAVILHSIKKQFPELQKIKLLPETQVISASDDGCDGFVDNLFLSGHDVAAGVSVNIARLRSQSHKIVSTVDKFYETLFREIVTRIVFGQIVFERAFGR